MQDFKQLAVWHKAHALFLACYRALGTKSAATPFWLKSQLLKAAASISANIAEGCGKRSTREFVRFLEISIGSARELENHLIVARDIGAISPERYLALNDMLTEVRRMLIGLVKALSAQEKRA